MRTKVCLAVGDCVVGECSSELSWFPAHCCHSDPNVTDGSCMTKVTTDVEAVWCESEDDAKSGLGGTCEAEPTA